MGYAHLTGDLKLVADQIGEWAQRQGQIVRLWFFRDRAQRTDSSDSDFGLAYEIDTLPSIEAWLDVQALRERWAFELSKAIGLEIHFEPIVLDQIRNAVTDHGVLVYERVGSPPCRWVGE